MAVADRIAADYEELSGGCGLLDRSERGKLALTGSEADSFLNGLVSNEIEALADGEGCYAAVLTPKGKMLGDLRVLRAGDELLLDTERAALQEVFNVLWRGRIGHEVEVHKRTLEHGLLSLEGPRSRAVTEADDLAATEYSHRAAELDGIPVRLIVTDAGVDVLCEAARTDDLRAALQAPRRGPGVRRGGRGTARRARPAPLRDRPRRLRDPPGGRPQRARGVVHQGLLRGPGDGRASPLPGQAEPASARAAPVGPRAGR